jgi:biotin operon repressor
MSNQTQTFKLYELLKSGEFITVEKISTELDINIGSVPVYIHALKKLGAIITSNRENRKVISYQMDKSYIDVPEFRKSSKNVKPKVAMKQLEEVTFEDPDDAINTVTDKEIIDIHTSLGLESIGNVAD